MESEFILLTIALVILNLIALYIGVKFVICLSAILHKVPNYKENISQPQCSQKTNSETEPKRMQICPFGISTNNPENHSDNNCKSDTVKNKASHTKVIIKRLD
jgi:hypothetical protein